MYAVLEAKPVVSAINHKLKFMSEFLPGSNFCIFFLFAQKILERKCNAAESCGTFHPDCKGHRHIMQDRLSFCVVSQLPLQACHV